MTMFGTPCDSAEQAAAIALDECIRTKGDFCLAYGGVACHRCPKRKEGLGRRRKEANRQKKETIKEMTCGEDFFDKDKKKRIRLRKTDCYYIIEFGKRYSDNPTIFCVSRQLLCSVEELKYVKELIAIVI